MHRLDRLADPEGSLPGGIGALNAAQWAAYQHIPVPILFVCEDNGLGISVNTPPGWIEKRWSGQPGLTYVTADGLDLVDTYDAAARAVERCRKRREGQDAVIVFLQNFF